MKKYILLSFLMSYTILLCSQTLEENKTDEFTRSKILRSSWEILSKPGLLGMIVYVRASYINGITYLDTKIIHPKGVFAVDKGEIFTLILTSGEIIKLYNPEYRVTSIGEGAREFFASATMGMMLEFEISDDIILKFKTDPPKKIILKTSVKYFEGNVNKREAKRLVT